LVCAAAAHAAAGEAIVLAGGTVHPVNAPAIENGMVVMRNGKIEAVGLKLVAPAGATVVSCTGRHVYPGMISALSVLGLTEVGSGAGATDWQETGGVNPGVRAEGQIDPESALRPVARVSGQAGALGVDLHLGAHVGVDAPGL